MGACTSSKPAATASTSTIAQSSSNTSAATGTQPQSSPGNVDCTALKTALADILVNWQLVIGFVNSPSSDWAQVPLGSVSKFGDQLATVKAALGSDANAAAALSFMSGANDIVARGLGGDTAAQADLAKYLGTDVTASISKQLPISLAYQNAGCK
ncbi:MAG: hypothetical protein ACXV5U_04715 [Ilumatobacteraceae bacterium]